jgi:hypothetical protein
MITVGSDVAQTQDQAAKHTRIMAEIAVGASQDAAVNDLMGQNTHAQRCRKSGINSASGSRE